MKKFICPADYWHPLAAEVVRALREAVLCRTTEEAEIIADQLTMRGVRETREFLAREIEENAETDQAVDRVLRKMAKRRELLGDV